MKGVISPFRHEEQMTPVMSTTDDDTFDDDDGCGDPGEGEQIWWNLYKKQIFVTKSGGICMKKL